MASPYRRMLSPEALITSVTLARQQARALAQHCRLAAETAHPRFGFVFAGHTVVLTVNSGYE